MTLTILEALIPFALPMIIALVIKLVGRLPKWAVPTLLLPTGAAILEYLAVTIGGGEFGAVTTLLLAGASSFVYEVTSQLRSAMASVRRMEPPAYVGD